MTSTKKVTHSSVPLRTPLNASYRVRLIRLKQGPNFRIVMTREGVLDIGVFSFGSRCRVLLPLSAEVIFFFFNRPDNGLNIDTPMHKPSAPVRVHTPSGSNDGIGRRGLARATRPCLHFMVRQVTANSFADIYKSNPPATKSLRFLKGGGVGRRGTTRTFSPSSKADVPGEVLIPGLAHLLPGLVVPLRAAPIGDPFVEVRSFVWVPLGPGIDRERDHP